MTLGFGSWLFAFGLAQDWLFSLCGSVPSLVNLSNSYLLRLLVSVYLLLSTQNTIACRSSTVKQGNAHALDLPCSTWGVILPMRR